MKDRSVLIMMASYNGERYIKKQIESIMQQTHKNFLLVIQDDNSTDNTVEIIKQLQKIDERIILWNNSGKHGPYENFHSLINKCKELKEFDYYMFSDHDDIWNSDKIECFVSELEEKHLVNEPVMAYADMCIIDDNDNTTNESVNSIFHLEYDNKWSTLFNHVIYGCNSILNKKLFDLVPSVDINNEICHILCHDNYYGKFAAFFGKLIYIDKPLMKYRRYSSNVTAAHDYSYGMAKICKYLKSIDSLAIAHARTYSQSIYTIERMKECKINESDNCALDQLIYGIKNGGLIGVRTMLKYRISCGLFSRTMSRYFILFSKLHIRYLQ